MTIIPVINCADKACAAQKIALLNTFLPQGSLVHFDVTDGAFSAHATWNDPAGWATLASPFPAEVHLMVEHPEEHVDDWFAAGARRLIVHVEAITPASFHMIAQSAERHRGELMLSSRPETSVDEIAQYFGKFSAFQVLAVAPGAAGQKFLPFVEEKIRAIREELPDVIIEVDGGMNPDTVRLVQSFGADTVVSASYIFDSPDPAAAYETLMKI